MEDLGLILVCQSCMLVHANGECGDVHAISCASWGTDPNNGDNLECDCGAKEPLSAIQSGYSVTMGMDCTEHAEDCVNRSPDHDSECDCGTDTFSRSQCQGCGSYLHGERYAMHLWKD